VSALALGACESSTAPDNRIERIAVGTLVSGSLATGDSGRAYLFPATADSRYVVFAAVLEGTLQLSVRDSAQQSAMATAVASPSGRPVQESTALQFTARASGTYVLGVSGYPTHTAVRFQFLIYVVHDAPENGPAAFAISDTVSGETLDPVADIDVFTAHLQAGQDFVVVAEAPAATGVGPLALAVWDSTETLGFAFFPTGVPAAVTTGRIHAPVADAYWFRFEAAGAGVGGSRRFHGAYRFWTYTIEPAPERRSAAVPLATVIGGETLDRAGDLDVFTFSAAAGDELNAFYQSAVPSHLEIAPPSGLPIATVSAGPDTALFGRNTGRMLLTQTGSYLARVSADGPTLSDTGAYRFFLYPIDRRPEHVAAAIIPGDSIAGEAVDLPGDVDEFTFTASAGEEFTAFLQAQHGSAPTQLGAVDADATVLATVQSTGADTSLLGQATPRFAVRTTGTHRLRVEGAGDAGSPGGGPYRLFLARINRQPESWSDTLAPGDTVVDEEMDLSGDVDEYVVHVPDSSGAYLVVQLGNVAPGGHYISAVLTDSASGTALGSAISYGWPGLTGTLALAPGSYVIRVEESYTYRPVLRGPYRLWLYRFSFRPEAVRDSIVPGDTVSGEALDVPGDVDAYRLYVGPRQHVNVMIQGLSSGIGGFWVWISTSWGRALALVSTPLASDALADHQTLRLDLLGAGWYNVGVSPGTIPAQLSERGAYRLAVLPADTLPEAASPSLAIGDSLTTEAVDFVGDWDQYTVTAPPGQELNVLFGNTGRVLVFDPETGDTLAATAAQGDRIAGPARVPASGTVAVAVFEPPSVYFRQCYDATCGGVFHYTGPYHLQLLLLNRAPETAPATYTLGDTVRTEAILPAGDLDEFTMTATPGDTLSPWYRLRANPMPAGSLIKLEVIDPTTGTVLVGAPASVVASGPSFFSPGSFVVPAAGQVLIRLRGTGTDGNEVGTAPYEFYVRRGPAYGPG
jgi:hypothetical protein